MSKTSKIVTALLIVIVLIVIGLVWHKDSKTMSPVSPSSNNTAPVSDANSAPASQDNSSMSASNDSSDAALQQDLNSVDSQMVNINSDTNASAQ